MANYEKVLEEFRTKKNNNSLLSKDREKIEAAIRFGSEKHKGQTRKISSDPYFILPVRVAMTIVPEHDITSFVIIAALLHDTIEDTDTTLEEIERKFGNKVSLLVDGMTKPETLTKHKTDNIKSKTDYTEYFTKIIQVSKQDKRVFKLKLSDRADNLREYLMFATIPKIELYVWETYQD